MSGEPRVSLHDADAQHPGGTVIDGVADDVLNAQPADDTHDAGRREADRIRLSEDNAVSPASVTPVAVDTARTDQVTDDRDYSGATAVERTDGQVERDAPPADDKDQDGSPESLVAETVDPQHDDHADSGQAAPDDLAAAASTDSHEASTSIEDHGSIYVDDGAASG